MRDLAKTTEQRELIDAAITNMTEMYAIYALPPGVPSERVAALRNAFAMAWKDPALIEDAEKAQLALNSVPASVIEQRVQDFLSLPPDAVDKLRRVLQP
jgi:tripartite-type tricarboxylate transporter receptor subunit TctC